MIYSRPRPRPDATPPTPTTVPMAEHQAAIQRAVLETQAESAKRIAELEGKLQSPPDTSESDRLKQDNENLRSRVEALTGELQSAREHAARLQTRLDSQQGGKRNKRG